MLKIADSDFKKLLGTWSTSGTILSGQKKLKITGTDTYQLILDNNYILHQANVLLGDQRSETIEIIKLDNPPNKAVMQYFNSKREDGVMYSSIYGNEFIIQDDELKFIGEFNSENTTIKGKWYTHSENQNLADFIEITLQRNR